MLKDQHENVLTLSELKGKKILLSFHPLAWTKVCADQMKSLEENREALEKLYTVALGFSVIQFPVKPPGPKNWELNIRGCWLISPWRGG